MKQFILHTVEIAVGLPVEELRSFAFNSELHFNITIPNLWVNKGGFFLTI